MGDDDLLNRLLGFAEQLQEKREKEEQTIQRENENRRLAENLGISINTAVQIEHHRIKQLNNYDQEYQTIHKYFVNSQVRSHCDKYRVTAIDLIAIYKIENHERFKLFSNRFLLWHGTKEEELPNIINDGLKITNINSQPDPRDESPREMFANEIYFADRVTKSMQDVESITGNGFDRGYHCILLCEVDVEMGSVQSQRKHLLKNAARRYDSVKGAGRYIPDPKGYLNIDGNIVPAGSTILDESVSGDLEYNEYVIYNENYARVKYIISYRVNK